MFSRLRFYSKRLSTKIALGFLATTWVSLSTWAAVNPAIYGRWSSVQELENMTYSLTVDIGPTESSLSVTCAQQGKSVTARVSVPTEVTETQLVLKGSASDTKKWGDLECAVEVFPMEFDYELQGTDDLILSAQGQAVPFKRVQSLFQPKH